VTLGQTLLVAYSLGAFISGMLAWGVDRFIDGPVLQARRCSEQYFALGLCWPLWIPILLMGCWFAWQDRDER